MNTLRTYGGGSGTFDIKNLIVIRLVCSRINLPHRRGELGGGRVSVKWTGRLSAGSLKMRLDEQPNKGRLTLSRDASTTFEKSVYREIKN